MTEAIGIALLDIGAILGIWGLLWRLLDNRATSAAVLMAIGLVALIIGEAIT